MENSKLRKNNKDEKFGILSHFYDFKKILAKLTVDLKSDNGQTNKA